MAFATATTGVNKVATVPAPTGGLNARDSVANMPETDALALNNWWPEPYGCSVRPGSFTWASGIYGFSGSLGVWNSAEGDSYLFAIGRDLDTGFVAIYDVSNRQGPLEPAPVPLFIWAGGSTDPYMLQTVNDAGTHLFFIPGGDASPLVYDSTGFHDISCTAGPAPEPPADYTWYDGPGDYMSQITSHQGRLWGTDGTSSVGWYLPVDAIYGQWTSFDFGPQFTLGGSISYMATWTMDDGNGAEDHLVVVSSKGQAVVYGGTDPSTIDTWSLVGVYTVGEPVGLRGKGCVKVGGDLVLLTQRGLVSMSTLLISTRVNEAVTAVNSAKVQALISAAVLDNRDSEDWQLFYHPAVNLFLLNMPPLSTSAGQRQLAANLVTAASPWTAFSGIPANTWVVYDNKPFIGTPDGRVLQGWTGRRDEVGLDDLGGRGVKTQVQQAYSFLGAPAVQKQVGMYRPGFLVDASITFGAVIEYDFVVRRLRIPSAGPGDERFGLWAVKETPNPMDGIWDQTVWYGGVYPDRRWIQAQGIGTAVSLRMSMQSEVSVMWLATDYSYRVGAIL